MHGSLREQLEGVTAELGNRKEARRQKPKPNPSKAAKKAVPAQVAEQTSPAPADEVRPRTEIVLLHLKDVRHCEVVGNLSLVARNSKGTRHLCMRFDFTGKADARWEVQILPIDAEREFGWVSCYYIEPCTGALHVYDLEKAKEQVVMRAAA